MEHGDPIAKRRAETIDRLRRERDLGHEHDGGLPSLIHDPAQQLDVDECLAAPGNPVQEKHLPLVCARHRVHRGLLRGGWLEPRRRDSASSRERIALDLLVLDDDVAPLLQCLEYGRRELGLIRKLLNRGPPAQRFYQLEYRALLSRPREDLVALQKRGDVYAEPDYALGLASRIGRFGAGERGRENCAKSHAERHDVVVGHPLAQIQQRGADGGLWVGRLEHGLGLSLERTDIHEPNDDADLFPVAQRNHYSRANAYRIRETFFYCVGECLEQRQRQRDLDEQRLLLTHSGTPRKGLRWALAWRQAPARWTT